jgi:hypothetical protein
MQQQRWCNNVLNNIRTKYSDLWTHLQNCKKKRLLASDVCVSAFNNFVSIGRILMKFNIDGFLENLLTNSSFVKTWQEYRVLYVKIYVRLWKYLAKSFAWWGMFRNQFVEKIKTDILYWINPFRKSCRLWDVKKCGRDTPPMKIQYGAQNMRSAWRVTEARIKTHFITFDIHYFSMETMVTRTRLSVLLYVHCLFCY